MERINLVEKRVLAQKLMTFHCAGDRTSVQRTGLLVSVPSEDECIKARLQRMPQCCVISITNNFPDSSKVHGPTWGPSGADRTHVGPMLAP